MRCKTVHIITLLTLILGLSWFLLVARTIKTHPPSPGVPHRQGNRNPSSFTLNISMLAIQGHIKSNLVQKDKTNASVKHTGKLYKAAAQITKKSAPAQAAIKAKLSKSESIDKFKKIKIETNNQSVVLKKSPPPPTVWPQEFPYIPNCVNRKTGVEDILCMRRPDFLPQFKNPCWLRSIQNKKSILRCLPYFQIIGVCKSGTTDLFNRITSHPHVIPNLGLMGKETWYWTWRRYGHMAFHNIKRPNMALIHFVNVFNAKEIKAHPRKSKSLKSEEFPIVTGHGDPMDFWDHASWPLIPQNNPDAAEPNITTPSLIKHLNPNIKLILILRDPVERIYSNYLKVGFGNSSESFHRDVMTTLDMLKNCRRRNTLRSCLYNEDVIRKFKVPLSGSFYSLHLKEWLKVFPRHQLHILRNEDYARDIATHLRNIYKFLKLENISNDRLKQIAAMPRFYQTKQRQRAGKMLTETKDILTHLFAPFNQDLADILGDEKFLWKQKKASIAKFK